MHKIIHYALRLFKYAKSCFIQALSSVEIKLNQRTPTKSSKDYDFYEMDFRYCSTLPYTTNSNVSAYITKHMHQNRE